ncbi:RIO1-domain-containing protein [Clavulina sp. PMI_390]|nr:RIO1-domain-containing protein [Clavulina sp. PMI_390]
MKLDATDLRYVTSEEFRVLTAVEMGSKNHEVVPNSLTAQISGLRGGGVNKILGQLARRGLVAKVQNSKYDGYRLTYGGYDYLALRAVSKRGSVHSVGNQVGVGKESDIYAVADEEGNQMILKMHRLGRISFRAIKDKRDYLGKRKSASWMYMSRLAAQKEWAFMKVLYEHGFPVPKPIDQARHCIVMSMIDSYPLRQIDEHPNPGHLYSSLMDLIVRFANAGLIHGDFNEFNILIERKTGEAVVIDFPQMVSTSHPNAEWYFNRDVECIRTFFRRRFKYESALYPRFKTTLDEATGESSFRLDVMVAASGFKNKDQQALEEYMLGIAEREGGNGEGDEDEEEEEEEESEEEEGNGSEEDAEEQGEAGINQEAENKTLEADGGNEDETGPITSQTGALSLESSDTTLTPQTDTPHAEGDEPADPSSPTQEQMNDSENRMRDIVASQVSKSRAREKSKYHSRKNPGQAGRAKGSKAKQDIRHRMDTGGFWE